MGGAATSTREAARLARFEVRDYFAQAYRRAFGKDPIRHPSGAHIVDLILGEAHGDVDEVCRRIDRLLADPLTQVHGAALSTVFARWEKLGARRKAGAA